MSTFDLNRAIEYFQLNAEDVAKLLFPSAKYPKLALTRILKGEADLSVKQLYDLASFIGITVSDLLACDSWKGTVDGGYLTFIKGEYRAKLIGAYLTLYKGAKLITKEAYSKAMSIEDFINHINNLIINFNKKSNGSN